MSPVGVSEEISKSGSLLEKIKTKLHDTVDQIKLEVNNINNSVVQPIKKAADNISDSVKVLKEGADALKQMASNLVDSNDAASLGKAAEKFDGDWDNFAADFDKLYQKVAATPAGTNILEDMVRSTLGDKVFETGSIIKTEAPGLLGGLGGIQTGLADFGRLSTSDLLTRAKQIKDATEKIAASAQQLDASLNNVFTRVTNQLGVNATSLINLQSQLHSLAGNVAAQVPADIKTAVARLGDGIDVLDSSRTMITAIIADCQGEVSVQSVQALATHLDGNWDDFAKKANALYANLTGGSQQNILETFAKSRFGDNVFYAGSAIKNELSGVLSGVSDFQNSINIFHGDYSNPLAAAQTIKNGVEAMVKATEKIAGSLNNAVKIFQGRGNAAKAPGLPLLDTMSKIGDNKVVKVMGNSLALGTDGLKAAGDVTALVADLKAGNYKQAWDHLKKTLSDSKAVIKDAKSLIKNERPEGFDPDKNGAQQQGGGEKKEKEEDKKEDEDQDDASQRLSAGGNSYVCSGATLRCPFGDRTSKLTVYPDRRVYLTGQPMANISDHTALYNIHPFGKCRTTSYPATGAATAANHGVLTPMPCVPGTITPWMQGKNDYIVKGQPALLKTSFCRCQWGGIITITDDGQRDTGGADMSRERRETPEEMKATQEAAELAENAALDPNSVLDGIQTALDLAGFAPGVGAIPDLLNAAISACRGNWAEAGLSVLAAVPGIGDAAAGVKLANRGLKIAKVGQKVEKTADMAKGANKIAKVGDVSKQASKVDDVAKQVAKAESKPVDFSKYKKEKTDRLIDESPNVRRFPSKKATTDTPAVGMEKGKSGDLIQMDHYEVKQVKVGNGKTENVLEKKTDTIVNSIKGVSDRGSVNRPYTTVHSSDLPVQPISNVDKVGARHKETSEYVQEAAEKMRKKEEANVDNLLPFREKHTTGDNSASVSPEYKDLLNADVDSFSDTCNPFARKTSISETNPEPLPTPEEVDKMQKCNDGLWKEILEDNKNTTPSDKVGNILRIKL